MTPSTQSSNTSSEQDWQENWTNIGQFQKKVLEEHLSQVNRFRQGLEISQNWEPKVGQTPHDLVYEDGKLRLLHYRAQGEKKYKTPLLIVFSLINRSYILDLKPGKSIVEQMVQAGFDVYLIDWGIPGKSDQFLTIDDYVNRYMHRVVNFIQDHADVEQVSVMGYCMGGTLVGMYGALHPEKVKNLIFLAAPFDFSEKDGLLNIWVDQEHFDVSKLVEALGNIPPWFLQSSFNLLKPMQNMLDKYIKFYEKLDDDRFVDDFLTLEYWLNDNIPLSGQVYKQFVTDCFQKNLLIQNKLYLGGNRVDLAQIECPVLSIIASSDHLVPPCSSIPIHEEISSTDKDVMEFKAGHIGLSISGKAIKQLWPQAAAWLGSRSEKFETSKTKK
jgi:polyhydroxyalkanoate synthase